MWAWTRVGRSIGSYHRFSRRPPWSRCLERDAPTLGWQWHIGHILDRWNQRQQTKEIGVGSRLLSQRPVVLAGPPRVRSLWLYQLQRQRGAVAENSLLFLLDLHGSSQEIGTGYDPFSLHEGGQCWLGPAASSADDLWGRHVHDAVEWFRGWRHRYMTEERSVLAVV